MISKITNTLIKMVLAYKAGELCGHLLQAKMVDDRDLDDSTDAMKLGTYFEYIAFGNLPKNGKIPKPEYTGTGKMTAEYTRAHLCAEEVQKWFKAMGFEIIKKGWKVTKGRYQGTIDLMVRCTKEITFADGHTLHVGDEIVIDVKYSGLLEDRWSKHGWAWSQIQIDYHGIQARQYHYLTGRPFYFLVKDNRPAGIEKVKFFRVEITEQSIEQHKAIGNECYEYLEHEAQIGFNPLPSLDNCRDCALRAKCPDRAEFPNAERIVI
jgi:hypothetical protein